MAFNMYPGLTIGAADLIHTFGTSSQHERYAKHMYAGRFGGTMCLTEAQAGSDVGASTTSARRNADGTFGIKGTKVFISGGDHDIAETIVHMVLARIEGAEPGTKGLSLFIVPKHRVAADGTVGVPNDVHCTAVEHKMGINGSATCVLSFGDEDGCIGELVGTAEHQGIRQMFQMMNYSRIGVGLQGLGLASSSYLNALEYARERKQGPSARNWKDPSAPKVAILEHADVRRMLLDMKCRVEGLRSFIYWVALRGDWLRSLGDADEAQATFHRGQVELLTPLIKAYGSDLAFEVASTAMQVFGGAGYVKDHPVEQHCRDAKILSIYEGTNGIQALDLVGRKLAQSGGRNAQAFFATVAKFAEEHGGHPVLGASVGLLQKAHQSVGASAMQFMEWAQSGKVDQIPLAATTFLRMMGELAIGWRLLDGAVVAERARSRLPSGHADDAFYAGKRFSAAHYCQSVLPGVIAKGRSIAAADRSPIEIPDGGF
jgi:alkylation response protein AidB-like acyl-CoA dehydrogenase